jgi:MSHA biogenesis protein MshL
MALRLLLITLVSAALLSACAVKKPAKAEMSPQETAPVREKAAVRETLPAPPPMPSVADLIPEPNAFDLLEGKTITIDAIKTPLSAVLYMAAQETGLNLAMGSNADLTRPITVTITNTPAREALDIITESAGMYYEVSGSTLRIKSFITKTYKIPYIHTTTKYDSKLGGDIIGGAADTPSTISGSFNLTYANPAERNDLYKQIADGVRGILFAEETRSEIKIDQGETVHMHRQSEGFNMNLFTGTLTVTAMKPKIELVDKYITEVIKEISKQVLIEAKMVEVIFNDINSYGIDWENFFHSNQINYSQNFASGSAAALESIGLAPVASLAYSAGGANALLNMLSRQGKIETLGNPRIRVVNGQSAIISSGNLIPYWEKTVDQGEDYERTVSYNRVTILDGIMLGVTPFINEDGTITLNIVPVSTVVENDKVQYGEDGDIVASFPILNLKEAGTVLKVRNGETVIMGGMIDKYEEKVDQKVPFLGDVPVLGYIFKSKTTRTVKKELVIFIKTTVISI